MSSSTVEAISTTLVSSDNGEMTNETTNDAAIGKDEGQEDETSNNENFQKDSDQQLKQIIRYSTSTLFALRSSKLSQQKPSCKNMELSCMIHHKPPPKMLIASMMPKFALNQMANRGEESISPLSFHSNSSSSSNLSYQKRFQEGGGGNGGNSGGGNNDGYSGSRYYYNKYKNHEDITGSSGGGSGGGGNNQGGSSRIIYKTTGANNASNGNSIRFLKKAYSSKYEEHEESASSVGLISNKNILENSSRVITAADYRNTKKKILCGNEDELPSNDDKAGSSEKTPSDEANNNNSNNQKNKPGESERLTEVNANDLMIRNDLNNKKLPDDITNHLDDIFNDMSLNQLLDDKISEDRESSRFSKWFTVEGDGNAGKGEKSDPRNHNNNNNNNNSAMFASIHETEKYFQPIDKMEMFNFPPQQHHPAAPQAQKSPGNSGQVHSVEELEAKLRHHKNEEERKMGNDSEKKVLQNFFQQQMPNLIQQQPPPHQNQNQEEINAFQKLLSQITADDNKIPPQMMTSNGQQTNMLQQLMNKNFQQDLMIQQQYQKGFPMGSAPKAPGKMINHMIPPQQQQQQQFSGNLDLKFLQQQQQKVSPAPLNDIIKRPEIQGLVQELTSGEISQYNLWQRLTAPGLSPIEREIITCALNIFNANSNNANNPNMFAKQPPPPMSNNLFPPPPQGNPTNVAATQALHQLMQHQMKAANTLTAPIPIPQTSPLSPVPPLDQHLLFQHQAAVAANKQMRLSPLPAGMPQRIPSPRELQYHTQSIMQNALIRKKLEEQRENYRKRQEQEKQEIAKKNQQDVTPSGENSSDHVVITSSSSSSSVIMPPTSSSLQDEKAQQLQESPGKKTAPIIQIQQRHHAPSPSIFTLTPTSVLRKMTAEKEIDSKGEKKKSLLVGLPQNPPQQQQQQQPIRNNSQQAPFMSGNLSQMDRLKMAQSDAGMFGGNNNMNAWESQSMQGMKPLGRPIVKSSPTQPNQPNNPMIPQNNQVPSNMMNYEFQQQQQQQLQKMNIQKAQFLQQQQMMQMKKQQSENPVLSQFMAQQQQRAQAQSQFRAQFQQQQSMNFPMMQQQQQRDVKSDEPIENRSMMNNGGCLSPTSNQLAKWFSPELLADASAGKLPQSLNSIGGQMMSLEELEKCMQNS